MAAQADSTPTLSSSATQQQIAYFNEVLPYALAEQARTGIPAEVMIVQSGNETGWGTSSWWKNHNNPAGIGVTGAAGVGQSFASPQAGWDAYANDLLGQNEAGQQKFAADVKSGATSLQLVQDIEQGPWAAGHYGGNGLDKLLGQMFGNQGTGSDVGTVQTTSAFSNVVGSAGSAAINALFSPFQGVKNAFLLGGQAILGVGFIILGIIVILVDTGGVRKVGNAAMVAAVAA